MSPSTRGDGKTPPPREWHVVGVSAQTRNAGPAHDPVPELMVPFWQDPWASATVAVRVNDDARGRRAGRGPNHSRDWTPT